MTTMKFHKFKRIKELAGSNGYVRIIGQIISKTKNILLVDDGSGVMRVDISNINMKKDIEREEKYVRIFGEIKIDEENRPYIFAEIIQFFDEKIFKILMEYIKTRRV